MENKANWHYWNSISDSEIEICERILHDRLQRDIFLDEINSQLENDKNIYVMSADFGAASLDITREKFKENFIHCGISEQAMFDIGTGLALEGKKVVACGTIYFIGTIEQIKCGPAMMKLPMTILSVGIGLGYADAGPTHYATEIMPV